MSFLQKPTTKFRAQVSIGRVTSNTEDPYILLTLEDKDACVEFLEVKMSLDDFARTLTGQGCVEGVGILRNVRAVGTRHEVKRVVVPYTAPLIRDEAQLRIAKDEALKEFEVEGWTGHRGDLGNHHCRTSAGYTTTFTRFVDPETGEPLI